MDFEKWCVGVIYFSCYQSIVQPYFKDKSVFFITSKIYNYENTLKTRCSCTSFPSMHTLVASGQWELRHNQQWQTQEIAPKYRDAKSFKSKDNYQTILNAVEDYARRWSNREDVGVDSLSKWFNSIRSFINVWTHKNDGIFIWMQNFFFNIGNVSVRILSPFSGL